MNLLQRYYNNLSNPQPPGTGCHGWIMSTANLGAMSGKDPCKIFDDIRQAIPPGNRRVRDFEISDAIKKATIEHQGGTYIPRHKPKPIVNDGKATLQRIIGQGKFIDDVSLWDASPIRLLDEAKNDPVLLLETLYEKTELIWIGDRYESGIIGKTIRSVADWISYFRDGRKTAPHIILNPLTGIPAPVKNGDKHTLRGDGNISVYKYCLTEFDTLNREEQIKFWSAVKLPIIALIDSGGKSIHAWLQVSELADVKTQEQWQSEIKGHIYDRLLTPLGVDGACSNPARLSRLPGHYREEKGNFQKLLWLSPEGRQIIC